MLHPRGVGSCASPWCLSINVREESRILSPNLVCPGGLGQVVFVMATFLFFFKFSTR